MQDLYDAIDKEQGSELINTFGSPIFLCSEQQIGDSLHILQSVLSEFSVQSRLAYSFKTNYLSRVCKKMLREGIMAEVVSGAEYHLARNMGFEGRRIIFNGPLKTDKDLKAALLNNTLVNIDSAEEYARCVRIARELSLTNVPVGVRLNSSSLSAHLRNDLHILGWHERFGFNIENGDAQRFCKYVAEHSSPLSVTGYHMHIATNIKTPETYRHAASVMSRFASKIKSEYGIPHHFFDLGGGLPVQSTKDEELARQRIRTYIHAIISGLNEFVAKDSYELILEPGRSIVGGAFSLITRVVSVKNVLGQQCITIDAGLNVLFAGSAGKYPLRVLSDNKSRVPSITVGPSCMAIEIISRQALPEVEEGDLILIQNCGAYSLSRSSQFIFGRPAVLWLDSSGAVSVARAAETPDDMIRLDT